MMIPDTLLQHERRVQALVVASIVMLFSLTALAPHSERAMFEDRLTAPIALAAIVSESGGKAIRRFGWISPPLFSRAFREPPRFGARTVPSAIRPLARGIASTPPAAVANDVPSNEVPVLTGDANGLAPTAAAVASLVSNVPVTGIPGGFAAAGVAPGGGGGGGGETGTGPVTVTPPVTVVPEPGTWLMMLLGLGGIGVALRRMRRRGPVGAAAVSA